MYKVFNLVIIASAFFLFACSSEEKVINNSIVDTKILLVQNENNSQVSVLDLKTGDIVVNDVFSNSGITKPSGKISSIKERDNILYFVFSDASKIIALNKLDFSLSSEYDFSLQSKNPSDITFPNATDAYVTHFNSDSVTIIDIYNKAIVKSIASSSASRIVSSGNQIFAQSNNSNQISIFDSRTLKETNKIDLAQKAKLIGVTAMGDIMAISNGKAEGQIPSHIYFINAPQNKVSQEFDLYGSKIDPNSIEINDIAFTSKDYCFATTNQGFLRIDTESKDIVRFLNSNIYTKIDYLPASSQLIMLANKSNNLKIALAEATLGKEIATVDIPDDTYLIFSF